MLKITLLALGMLVPVGLSGHLHAAPATPSPAIQPGDIEVRTVKITTKDKLELEADYYAQDEDERAPAALLIHDAGADRSTLTDLAERLHRTGFAVLVPDLRGHGGSIAKPEDAFAKLEEDEDKARLWAFATRDIDASARWLRAQKSVHSANLNLLGVGAGCALAVRHGAGDENARSLTLIAPKAEMLGFHLVDDMYDLEGVPMQFIASRESKKDVQGLADEIHKSLGVKEEFIDVSALAAKKDVDLLDDRRLETTVSKPLQEIAFPQRGGRR